MMGNFMTWMRTVSLLVLFTAACSSAPQKDSKAETREDVRERAHHSYSQYESSGNSDRQPSGFSRWLNEDVRGDALQAGIDARVFDREVQTIRYLPKVIELDRKQPEHKITFNEYQSRTFTAQRVAEGRALLDQNRSLLNQIERQYGVPAEYIVSFWGMETSYGRNTGGYDLLSSLATLAYDGRRGAYFKGEFIKALKILNEGHIDRAHFKGSWAGAMGQVQFMPTTWRSYAVDYNGDGHKDIWTTRADAFASAANYLRSIGWNAHESWGREVSTLHGISESLIDKKIRKTAAEWAALGVRDKNGQALPTSSMDGTYYLVKPRSNDGKMYLGSSNLAAIMQWNNSSFFALTVGQLADAVAGRRGAYTSSASSSRSNESNSHHRSSGRIITNRPDLIPNYRYND